MTDASAMPAVPRHDFFQTETTVTVSVYVRNCQQDDVQLDVDERSLRLRIAGPSSDSTEKLTTHDLHISPLYGPVDRTSSSVRVLGSKIEISLPKLEPGVRWPALAGDAGAESSQASAGRPTIVSQPPSYNAAPSGAAIDAPPARPNRSKWDSFKDEEEAAASGDKANGEDEGGIDSFFKKLYADADDDTRRAMMKSYQESGGTTLSTNWAEVGKGKVTTKPPEGMEARKW